MKVKLIRSTPCLWSRQYTTTSPGMGSYRATGAGPSSSPNRAYYSSVGSMGSPSSVRFSSCLLCGDLPFVHPTGCPPPCFKHPCRRVRWRTSPPRPRRLCLASPRRLPRTPRRTSAWRWSGSADTRCRDASSGALGERVPNSRGGRCLSAVFFDCALTPNAIVVVIAVVQWPRRDCRPQQVRGALLVDRGNKAEIVRLIAAPCCGALVLLCVCVCVLCVCGSVSL